MKQLTAEEALEFISSLNTFAILDENARYTYVSKRWCELTGYTEEQVLGERVDKLFPDTMALKIYETGQPIAGHPVQLAGSKIFTNYSPDLHSGEIIGCSSTRSFTGQKEAMLFEKQLKADCRRAGLL